MISFLFQRKHILDALPYVGSSASVVVMKDVILKSGVPENTAKEWMLSLAFIARPTSEMMEAAIQLLQEKPFDASTILSVSALTHTYCSQQSDCINNEIVNTVLEKIQSVIIEIYYKRQFNRELQDQVKTEFFIFFVIILFIFLTA